MLETLMDLHETNVYKVRGREELSTAWAPNRGSKEGYATSPILFNVFHQAVMRQVKEGREVGFALRWVPGGSFFGVQELGEEVH